jgi:hypothetical protein
MDAVEIENYIKMARDFLHDKHSTPKHVEELNAVFPAWLLANSEQMSRLRELGFFREDFYELRHKLDGGHRRR